MYYLQGLDSRASYIFVLSILVNADFFECAADDSCAVSAVGSLDAFDESAEVQRLERSFRKTLLTSKESRRLLVSQNPKRAFRVMFQGTSTLCSCNTFFVIVCIFCCIGRRKSAAQ